MRKRTTTCVWVGILLLAFSVSGFTQVNDQILIKFNPNAGSIDMHQLMTDISAQPLDYSAVSGVHKWQVPTQFPFSTNGTTFYSVLDILEFTVGKAIVQGVDLNYSGSAAPVNAAQFNGTVDLASYTPLYGCSAAYPANIYAEGLHDYPVRIAIIDTGIDDESYPDLFGSKIYDSYDFIKDTPNAEDDNGHGTQVAGIIAGMAYNRKLDHVEFLELKAMDASGSGNLYDIIEAIEYAKIQGANIINCSFGYYPMLDEHYSNLFRQVIQDASDQGILVIIASGNDNRNLDFTKFYPGAYLGISNIIKVAASECDGGTTVFSNFGLGAVEIAGPGSGILCPTLGGHWIYSTGTSFAAPVTTGVAMQLASNLQTFDAGAIKSAIMLMAFPSQSFSGLTTTSGLVNIGDSINFQTGSDKDRSAVHTIVDLDDPKAGVFPNPFEEDFTFRFHTGTGIEGPMTIVLKDAANRPVWKTVTNMEPGEATVQFQDGSRLPAGFYILDYRSKNLSGRIQLIKK
ncbi:MAG TPA: S8 family peptidase [Flavilitoribacter sp.]|nr:S8 family peptidase [Flavilitoribacter sp.]HMQ87620.1 S8 family peptidase [Flavilitoribacter sp.]